MSTMTQEELDVMVGAATIDCYTDEEQVSGFCTKLEDNLALPFTTQVLGVEVTVDDVELTDANGIVAWCSRDGHRQTIPVLDLPLPTPQPAGAEWITAYRYWVTGQA